jgi:hypothetical protein
MERSFLIRKDCVSKQLRSHCVEQNQQPASNPEPIFIRLLAYQEKLKLIQRVKSLYGKKSIRAIGEEIGIKRRDVQRILKDHVFLQSS